MGPRPLLLLHGRVVGMVLLVDARNDGLTKAKLVVTGEVTLRVSMSVRLDILILEIVI